MPLPKKKLSHARRGDRRSHLGLTAVQLVKCGHCQEMKRPHQVCPKCGHYAGRMVQKTENE